MTLLRGRARILATLTAALTLSSCHSNSAPPRPTSVVQHGPALQQGPVPTPPTADQISPSSPQAILNGTSTTQTTVPPPRPNQ